MLYELNQLLINVRKVVHHQLFGNSLEYPFKDVLWRNVLHFSFLHIYIYIYLMWKRRKPRVISSENIFERTFCHVFLWAINTARHRYSYRSCDESEDLLRAMFSDSKIAENHKMERTKPSYVISHGIRPFFHREVIQDMKQCERFCYVSTNKKITKIVNIFCRVSVHTLKTSWKSFYAIKNNSSICPPIWQYILQEFLGINPPYSFFFTNYRSHASIN